MPKEKIARFRIENRQFQHPERKEFPDGNQLAKIRDQNTRKSLKDAVACLAEFPNTPQVKKLTSHKYAYRLRVGRFRIFFDIAETIRIISIQEVKKRDDRTY